MRTRARFAVAAWFLFTCIFGASPARAAQAEQGSAANAGGQGASVPLRVGGNVMQGLLLRMVTPNYPAAAKAQGIAGDVVLRAVIGRDGAVKEVQAVSGPQMLIYPAETAVKQWQYRPYLLNGQPAEVETIVTVNFALDEGQKAAVAERSTAVQSSASQNPADAGATPIDAQFKANIVKLLDVTHALALGQQAAKTMFAQMRPALIASLPPTPHREQIVDAYSSKLSALLGSQGVADRLAGVYARHLSPEDVSGMIQFYQTPAGQHALASMPQIMAESQQIGASTAQENMPRIFGELCTQFPELRGKVKFCPATTKNESSERFERRWLVASAQWSAGRSQ